jgi:hypothetical protein
MYLMANWSPIHNAAYHQSGLGKTLTGSMVSLINLTFFASPLFSPAESLPLMGNFHPVLACSNWTPVSINLDFSASCCT